MKMVITLSVSEAKAISSLTALSDDANYIEAGTVTLDIPSKTFNKIVRAYARVIKTLLTVFEGVGEELAGLAEGGELFKFTPKS